MFVDVDVHPFDDVVCHEKPERRRDRRTDRTEQIDPPGVIA